MTPRDNIINILPLHHGYSSIVALLSPPGLSFPNVTLTVMDPIEPVGDEKETKDLYQETVNKWMEAMKKIGESKR